MSVDPDLRIALGFLVLLRAAIALAFGNSSADPLPPPNLRRTLAPLQGVIWLLLVLPLLLVLFDPRALARLPDAIDTRLTHLLHLQLSSTVRWILVGSSVFGLLLLIWVRTSPSPRDLNHGAGKHLTHRGPYRLIRYPDWLADLLFFGPLLIVTGSWGAAWSFGGACFLVRCGLLPLLDRFHQEQSPDYAEYAARTGYLLPPFQPTGRVEPTYYVPRNFGMSAVVALVTMFAVIFGLLNAFQSHIPELGAGPRLHLYFGLLLTFVWIAQMRFGQSARLASVLVGAILLPVFLLISFRSATLPSWNASTLMMLFILGGLLGYCMGAMAAGFFLVLDWIGPHLPGARKKWPGTAAPRGDRESS